MTKRVHPIEQSATTCLFLLAAKMPVVRLRALGILLNTHCLVCAQHMREKRAVRTKVEGRLLSLEVSNMGNSPLIRSSRLGLLKFETWSGSDMDAILEKAIHTFMARFDLQDRRSIFSNKMA